MRPLLLTSFTSSVRAKLTPLFLPAVHKKEFQAFKERELHPPAFVTSLFPKNQHISHIPGTQMVRRTLAHRKQQAKDAEEAEDGAPRRRRLSDDGDDERDGDAEGEGTDADDEGVTAGRQVYRHRRPEEYTNARSKLKLASASLSPSLPLASPASAMTDSSPCSHRVLPPPRHAQELSASQPHRLLQGASPRPF